MTPIEPLDADDPRVLPLVHEAAAMAHTTPELLEEIHLQAWAAIDPRTAAQQRERREAARERRRETVQRAQAAASSKSAAPGITAAELAAILEAVRETIDARISDRLARDLGPRLRALEQRAADVGISAPPRRKNSGTATIEKTPAPTFLQNDVIDAAILRVAPQIAAVIAARFEVEETALLARGGTLADYDALREDFAAAEAEAYAQLRVVLEHAAAAFSVLNTS